MANSKDQRKKVIKETFLFPHVEYMWLNYKVIKKSQPPISTSTLPLPLPFQVYPAFLAKHFESPKVTQFLEGPKGGGARERFQLCNILLKQVCEWYDFAVLEILTSRAWNCLFRFELINNIVFIQISFSNLSLIHKLKF